MPHSVACRDVLLFCDWQGAPCGREPASRDDKSPVMQGGIFEKEIHYKPSVYGGIYSVTRADDFFQRILVCDYYQRAGFFFSHSTACFGEVVYGFAGRSQIVASAASEYPVGQSPPACAAKVSVAEPY